jgi:primase-polymerase (primpol)-like protein
VAIDLDHCRDPATGTVELWAAGIVRTLASYAEASPSGTGVRVFVRGRLPTEGRKKGSYENYETGRYVTVTGQRLEGTPASVESRQQQLEQVHAAIFGTPGASIPPAPAGYTPAPGLTDDELICRAGEARNGDKLRALWSGGADAYPSASEADLALCRILAFWVGPDPERIDRLFRGSGRMRAKWDERRGRATYGQNTIRKALERTYLFSASSSS